MGKEIFDVDRAYRSIQSHINNINLDAKRRELFQPMLEQVYDSVSEIIDDLEDGFDVDGEYIGIHINSATYHVQQLLAFVKKLNSNPAIEFIRHQALDKDDLGNSLRKSLISDYEDLVREYERALAKAMPALMKAVPLEDYAKLAAFPLEEFVDARQAKKSSPSLFKDIELVKTKYYLTLLNQKYLTGLEGKIYLCALLRNGDSTLRAKVANCLGFADSDKLQNKVLSSLKQDTKNLKIEDSKLDKFIAGVAALAAGGKGDIQALQAKLFVQPEPEVEKSKVKSKRSSTF